MGLHRATAAVMTIGILGASTMCRAQSMRVEDLAQGKLIVAPRESPDARFAKSVIVLAQYAPQDPEAGALGLMLQYRWNQPVRKALPDVKGAEKHAEPIFIGGPVELSVALGLQRTSSVPTGARHVTGDIYLLTAKPVIGAALSEGRTPSELRVFLGYAGWGAGQLEREVRRRGWYIFDFDESLIFDDHPETLWERLIERTERRIARLQ